jgi:hypothetical protein
MDWTSIGADLITRLVPVFVVVTVYYVRSFLENLPPFAVNVVAVVLAEAYAYVAALAQNGTFDPIQAAALAGLATLLAEIIKNVGAQKAVKKVLPGVKE